MNASNPRPLAVTRLAIALALGGFGAAASAAQVDLSFAQLVVPPSATMAGTAPWLDVKIADTATPGTVAVTVSAFLTGSQTLTGIWLNIDGAAAGLTGLTLDAGVKGSGEDPFVFAAVNASPTTTQSGASTTQNIHPTGVTQSQTGDFNVYLRFANNAGAAFQTTETESFNLVANASSGLNALSFLATSAPTAGGFPNPPFYALASFTNAGGTGGSGIAYIAASPVPEGPASVLMLVGVVALALAQRNRRRKA